MNAKFFISLAAKVAIKRDDLRTFRHCAIAYRDDGVLVMAPNGSTGTPTKSGHAEFRLSRKLDHGAKVVFVVRVNRRGQWANSRPCASCRVVLRSKGVRKVIYTTGPGIFEEMDL